MKEMTTLALVENIETVIDFVDEQLEDWPQKIRNQIGIAVDEIFSNIAHYAYPPETGHVVVRVKVGEEILIEFEDKGVAYDPLAAPEPDITLSAEEREIGGLGLFMVKNLMDLVEYRRDGDTNVLTVKKGRIGG